MKKNISAVFLSVSILFLYQYVCEAGCNLITVHYNERVPYVQTTENGIEGLTATPATAAFKKALIPFTTENTSAKKALKIIEENRGCDCGINWFKNPEREKFAKFTHYIYQDKPNIALARADNEKLQNGITVDSVLSNPELTLLIKEGYYYGTFLEGKFVQHKPLIVKTTSENINMLKMVWMKRADYFFLAPEEADILTESSGIPGKEFKYIRFTDMPDGDKRYIMCSQNVGDEIIEKLNKAIDELYPEK